MNWTVVIGVLSALGTITGGGALVKGLIEKPKLKADAASVIASAAGQFAEDVAEQRAADRAAWDAERQRLESRIQRLEGQLDAQRTGSREARQSLEAELDGLRIRVRDLELLAADLGRQVAEKDATILRLSNGNGMRH